jgi:hypothetical protein
MAADLSGRSPSPLLTLAPFRAERRLLAMWVADARRHGTPPHAIIRWVRRKAGGHIMVWRYQADGTLACATPCLLCSRELCRFGLQVHCSLGPAPLPIKVPQSPPLTAAASSSAAGGCGASAGLWVPGGSGGGGCGKKGGGDWYSGHLGVPGAPSPRPTAAQIKTIIRPQRANAARRHRLQTTAPPAPPAGPNAGSTLGLGNTKNNKRKKKGGKGQAQARGGSSNAAPSAAVVLDDSRPLSCGGSGAAAADDLAVAGGVGRRRGETPLREWPRELLLQPPPSSSSLSGGARVAATAAAAAAATDWEVRNGLTRPGHVVAAGKLPGSAAGGRSGSSPAASQRRQSHGRSLTKKPNQAWWMYEGGKRK